MAVEADAVGSACDGCVSTTAGAGCGLHVLPPSLQSVSMGVGVEAWDWVGMAAAAATASALAFFWSGPPLLGKAQALEGVALARDGGGGACTCEQQ